MIKAKTAKIDRDNKSVLDVQKAGARKDENVIKKVDNISNEVLYIKLPLKFGLEVVPGGVLGFNNVENFITFRLRQNGVKMSNPEYNFKQSLAGQVQDYYDGVYVSNILESEIGTARTVVERFNEIDPNNKKDWPNNEMWCVLSEETDKALEEKHREKRRRVRDEYITLYKQYSGGKAPLVEDYKDDEEGHHVNEMAYRWLSNIYGVSKAYIAELMRDTSLETNSDRKGNK